MAQGHRVRPLYVDSQLCWQAEELRASRRFLAAIDRGGSTELVVLKLPLDDLYANHWSLTGRNVPGAHDPDERVYLPGRNPLLLVKALVWCRLQGVEQLALGSLKSNPFADATDEFFAQFEAAMDRALSARVELVRPLGTLDKREVMRLGRDMPLELTFSCLAPRDALHCGRCNKCAERQRAFRQADMRDPTPYAAQSGAIAI